MENSRRVVPVIWTSPRLESFWLERLGSLAVFTQCPRFQEVLANSRILFQDFCSFSFNREGEDQNEKTIR